MMRYAVRQGIVVLTLMGSLAACANNVDTVPVKKKWTETVRNFALIPIYPMREDVHVGDLRLVVAPDAVGDYRLGYRNLGHLPIEDSLQQYYAKRKGLPKLVKAPDEADTTPSPADGPGWQQPEDSSGIFTVPNPPGPVTRPRLAALPGVTLARFAGAEIGGGAPLGPIQAAFGLGGSDDLEMSITLSGIETIEAPDDITVIRLLNRACDEDSDGSYPALYDGEALDFSLRQLVSFEDGGDGKSEAERIAETKPQVVAITRVFYARAIDYSFSLDREFAANLLATLEGLEELQQMAALGLTTAQQQGEGEPEEEGSEAGEDEAPETPAPTQEAILGDLVTRVGELRRSFAAAPAPGVSAAFAFFDSRGLTLREVFERPLAFAADGLAVDASRPSEVCRLIPVVLSGREALEGDVPLGGPRRQ